MKLLTVASGCLAIHVYSPMDDEVVLAMAVSDMVQDDDIRLSRETKRTKEEKEWAAAHPLPID